ITRGLTGSGKRLEFINAGVPGYHSGQSYLFLLSDLIQYKPDLVVVYDGWNDGHFFNSFLAFLRTHMDNENERRLRSTYSLSGAAVLLFERLGIVVRQEMSKLGMVELPWRASRWVWPVRPDPNEVPVTFDPSSVELYRQSRRLFVALAEQQSFHIAIFLQPLVGVESF